MEASFDGQDYLLVLSKESEELQKLLRTKLETPLKMHFTCEDLGKILTLEFKNNDGPDGIYVKYFHSPENAKGWDKVIEIAVKINEKAYSHIAKNSRFGTRYSSNGVIEIYYR